MIATANLLQARGPGSPSDRRGGSSGLAGEQRRGHAILDNAAISPNRAIEMSSNSTISRDGAISRFRPEIADYGSEIDAFQKEGTSAPNSVHNKC
ncbi:hypothetical protein [Nonomuraea glycinis]|uniref:hypothetical protein n=1 Tax=Nonomuraea glycinis TaxID=2047744 RepID=UPI002E0D7F0C|nr:hypothetical protein OHA68_40140 [Nonomuraea glycinis]